MRCALGGRALSASRSRGRRERGGVHPRPPLGLASLGVSGHCPRAGCSGPGTSCCRSHARLARWHPASHVPVHFPLSRSCQLCRLHLKNPDFGHRSKPHDPKSCGPPWALPGSLSRDGRAPRRASHTWRGVAVPGPAGPSCWAGGARSPRAPGRRRSTPTVLWVQSILESRLSAHGTDSCPGHDEPL